MQQQDLIKKFTYRTVIRNTSVRTKELFSIDYIGIRMIDIIGCKFRCKVLISQRTYFLFLSVHCSSCFISDANAAVGFISDADAASRFYL